MSSFRQNVLEISSNVLSRLDARLVMHGERVGYLMIKVLEFCKTDKRIVRDCALLALFHDIGAYKTEEIDDMLVFETDNIFEHSTYGFLFLKYFSPVKKLAEALLFHHSDDIGELKGNDHFRLGQLIHLLDRIDIYKDFITERGYDAFFAEHEGVFDIQQTEIIKAADKDLVIIKKLADGSFLDEFRTYFGNFEISEAFFIDILKMLAYAIDFRSEHTVTHTIATEAAAGALGELCGLTDAELNDLKLAAILHDLGKIGVPYEILEKPAALSPAEMETMKSHVNITEEILEGNVNEKVRLIACRHHEKADGSGYPRGLSGDDLSLSEKILAVADITSALMGKRSYKEGFSMDLALEILKIDSQKNKLSAEVVNILLDNANKVMGAVSAASDCALDTYDKMGKEFKEKTATLSALKRQRTI